MTNNNEVGVCNNGLESVTMGRILIVFPIYGRFFTNYFLFALIAMELSR